MNRLRAICKRLFAAMLTCALAAGAFCDLFLGLSWLQADLPGLLEFGANGYQPSLETLEAVRNFRDEVELPLVPVQWWETWRRIRLAALLLLRLL